MKIKANFSPEYCSYLTPGKEYEVENCRGVSLCDIFDDEGDLIIVSLTSCAHIGGLNVWQIVESAEEQK